MNIQKINNTNPSFQALYGTKDLPKVLGEAIEKSPAMRNFAKKYDATVGYSTLGGKDFMKGELYPALLFSEMQPVNKVKRFIGQLTKSYQEYKYMFISTRKTTNSELAKKIEELPENYVIKRYKACMKSDIININII